MREHMLSAAGDASLVRSGISIIIPTFDEEDYIERTLRHSSEGALPISLKLPSPQSKKVSPWQSPLLAENKMCSHSFSPG